MKKFDKEYKKDEFYWGLKPNKIVRRILDYKKSGTVLDLGAGEGRDAIFLAKNGFDVTAVDVSKEGIKKLEGLASENGVGVDTIVSNITDFNFEKDYDIILSLSVLHFLKEREIKRLIERMKKYTSKNGLNVISVFTEDNPHKSFPYLFKKDELRNLYTGWEILNYREFMTAMERHNGPWHKHGMAELIAERVR